MKTFVLAAMLVATPVLAAKKPQAQPSPQVGSYTITAEDCDGIALVAKAASHVRDDSGKRMNMYLALMRPDRLDKVPFRALMPVTISMINDVYDHKEWTAEVAQSKATAACMPSVGKSVPYYI